MRRWKTGPVTLALFLGSALVVGPAALAWGPQGHRVIAKVAEDRLSPSAKAAIRDLLEPGDTMADIADWADREGHDAVPGSAPWHYINVPVGDAHFDRKEVRGEDNVVVQIEHARKVLADKSKPRRDRRRALLFLVHLVSDLHQPLHVGDNQDKGGNLTQVQFFGEGTNLHKLWDSDLIHKIGGNDKAWVARVEKATTDEDARRWAKGTVDDWAEETLQVAKLAYRAGEKDKQPMPSGTTLGEPYVKRVEPILERQMARASVRLAAELNEIFR